MMEVTDLTYLMSILMGIIQGVAEFLPISSSGHLALFQAFFGMENVEESHLFFTVLLHFGTLVSVCPWPGRRGRAQRRLRPGVW